MKDIYKFSDPQKVFNKAKRLYGNDIDIKLSTRQDKKYMIKHNNKWVHFGQIGYSDFTKTNDQDKKRHFQQRNHEWKNKPKYSPAYLSYHLLW